MKPPTFIRNAAQLDQWLERYNPMAGLTMTGLAAMLQDAEEGRHAETQWLIRKMMRRDETVRACRRRIYATLMKLEWRIKVMDELPSGLSPEQAEAQAKLLRGAYEQIENLKAACAALAMADLHGFAIAEKHYGAQGQIVRLEHVPQWHWWRDGVYGPWKYNPKARITPPQSELVEIDTKHFVVREVEDPWYEIALIKGLRINRGDRHWEGFVDTYGVPSTFFTAPAGASDEDLAAYQKTADGMVADGTGVLPNGAAVSTFETQQDGAALAKYIDRQQSAIVLAATGGLLTMLAQSGSGTLAGGAHQETWRELVGGIAAEVAETLQEQVDKVLLAERFPGQAIGAYFVLDFPEEEADTKATVESVVALKSAGYDVPADWVAEETGVPVVVAPANPAPPPPLVNRQTSQTSPTSLTRLTELMETAVADALDAERAMLAPLRAEWARLLELLQRGEAGPEDFRAAAGKVAEAVPELMDAQSIEPLARVIERALGQAAVAGGS